MLALGALQLQPPLLQCTAGSQPGVPYMFLNVQAGSFPQAVGSNPKQGGEVHFWPPHPPAGVKAVAAS